MKTNKKEILEAALKIFSEKGYERALLSDIAISLGITKPALYKHYESKEAIWNAMLEIVQEYYSKHMGNLTEMPIPESWDEFETVTLRQVNFTMHDETIKRVRKLITAEQFRNEMMSNMATKYFVTDSETRYTMIFAGMEEKGILSCQDVKMLAFQFTAPITVMIHLCDREPERDEEITKKIQEHIKIFVEEHKR